MLMMHAEPLTPDTPIDVTGAISGELIRVVLHAQVAFIIAARYGFVALQVDAVRLMGRRPVTRIPQASVRTLTAAGSSVTLQAYRTEVANA